MGAAYTGGEENLRLPTERGIHSDLWRPLGGIAGFNARETSFSILLTGLGFFLIESPFGRDYYFSRCLGVIA